MNKLANRAVTIELLEGRRLLAQAPFYGTPFSLSAGLTTIIQAEDYDLGGEGAAYHDTTATNTAGAYRTGADEGVDLKPIPNTTGQYRISDAYVGEWVEYSIDVQQAGTYTLDLRVSNADPNAKLHVEIDGLNVTGAVTVPDTNSFNTFSTVSRTIELDAGARVLRLSFDVGAGPTGSVAGVDWIRLTHVEEPPPPPPPGSTSPFHGVPFPVGASPVTIQAEDYDLGGEGAAYHDTTATNSAGAYRTGSDAGVDLKSIPNVSNQYRISDAYVGEWVEYSLNVQQAGTYTLDLRLSNSSPNAQLHVEIDGLDVTGAVTVPDTNSFNTFSTVSRTIELEAGAQSLRLAFDVGAGSSGSVAGVDWLRLTGEADLAALQREFLDRKYGMFIHFNMDSYTNGDDYANAPVDTFNPKRLDTDQWASAANAAGMKYGMLTTKHHSGFALWDSNKTSYDVAASRWGRDRKAAGRSADVVKMYADSFREQGLGVGLYYSILDHRAGIHEGADPSWATNHVKSELTQLLTNYGPIQVLWTDGWGWEVEYDTVNWREVYDHIKAISPNTLLMENNHEYSYAHTDIIGYESPTKGSVPSGNTQTAEVSDTIRSGNYWFYRTWDPALRSVDYLVNARKTANDRNANYLLNVGPNRDGLIPSKEVNHLKAVQEQWLKG